VKTVIDDSVKLVSKN